MRKVTKMLSGLVSIVAMLAMIVVGMSENLSTVSAAEETSKYYMMNVPYSAFYSGLNNAGTLDAVSSATSQKAASCQNVYVAATPVISGGTTISGVQVPVKMTESVYASVKSLVTDATKDYYIGEEVTTTPDTYLELTSYKDGKYTFSKIQGTASEKSDVEATISDNTNWGNYEIDIKTILVGGTYTNAKTGKETNRIGYDPAEVYGSYMTTDDGKQYAMVQSANLWSVSDYYEFGWFVKANATDIHGAPQQGSYYSAMQGHKVVSITFITKSGIVTCNLKNALEVKTQCPTDVTGEFTDANTLSITVPSSMKNAKVTVSYRGADRTTNYNVDAAEIVNGKVTLDTAVTDENTYSVVVTSDNYAACKLSLKYTSPAGSGDSATEATSAASTQNASAQTGDSSMSVILASVVMMLAAAACMVATRRRHA